MNIFVCVGSSCHLRGSAKIVELIKDAVKENNLEDKIKLSGAFCLGKCTEGVSIKLTMRLYAAYLRIILTIYLKSMFSIRYKRLKYILKWSRLK